MKNKKGFTLIELILVLALIGIVLSMVFSPIIFTFKNFDIQNKKSNVISDARAAMDYLTREIRRANDFNDPRENSNENQVIAEFSIYAANYKFENNIILKDGKKIMEGINELYINNDDGRVKIRIKIEDYEISSYINLR